MCLTFRGGGGYTHESFPSSVYATGALRHMLCIHTHKYISLIKGFSAEEKKYLLVRADDVFFSFIPELKPDSDGGGQSLTLGTISFNPCSVVL